MAGCSEKAQQQSIGENLEDGVELVFYHGKWRQTPKPLENHLEDITFDGSINFAPGSAALSSAQLAQMKAFFNEAGISPENTVQIESPNPQAIQLSALDSARIAVVDQAIKDMGLNAKMAVSRSAFLAPGDDRIDITVTKLMVISPDCEEPQPAAGQRPTYRFTCSSASNLGAMVVNPLDLREGRPDQPSDGDAASKRVQKYREADQEELIIEKTGSD
ncbi:MAG: CpaD family pilus assembly lipoprotein [Pseudomonadota bacterium]